MALRYNAHQSAPVLNTLVSGSVVTGNAVSVGDIQRQKAFYLCAQVSVTPATASLTFTAKWQVSPDNSTWTDVSNGTQNAASVVLATGTSAAVARVIPAPTEVYGNKFARLALTTGGATAGVSDVCSIGYNYRTTPV